MRLLGFGFLGEIDQGAAVGADCQVGERLLVLVRGKGVFGEGAEQVRVGVVAGLEEVVHLVAGCWLSISVAQ
jgi:hypothetical protein